jgi:hypothetical protein
VATPDPQCEVRDRQFLPFFPGSACQSTFPITFLYRQDIEFKYKSAVCGLAWRLQNNRW